MNRLKFCVLLILALPALADDAGHPVTLWKVGGQTNSIYLLGSIHLLRNEDYPLPVALDAAYDSADVLIMEIDMDDLDPIAMQTAFTRHGVLHDETTLRDLMGEDMYDKAAHAAELVDIPLDMLSKTEPWYAAMTVEIMMLGRMGFNPALGIEMYMVSKAAIDGKRIDGLETIEEQIQFLDGMSMQAQREMLMSTLVESAKLDDTMDDLIDAWRHGDAEFLATRMLDEMAQHEELNKLLVVDRNTRWVERIESLLQDDEDYLIVVGALHLVGEDGVPRMLKRAGHDVQQLSEQASLR